MKNIFLATVLLIVTMLSFGCITKNETQIVYGQPEIIIKEEPVKTTHRYIFEQDPYIEEGFLKCKICDEEVKFSKIKRTEITPKIEQKIKWKETASAKEHAFVILFKYPLITFITVGIIPVCDICSTLFYPIHGKFMPFYTDMAYHSRREISGSRKVLSSTNLSPESTYSYEPKSITNKYPAKGISVKAEYDDKLLMNDTVTSTSSITDGAGVASFRVTAQDGFFFSEQEASKTFIDELNEKYYVEKLENILRNTPIISKEKSTFSLATRDDKWGGSFSLFTKNQSLQTKIDRYIKQLLNDHISRMFAPRTISIDVRDIDSLAMLDDVRFELKPVDIITEQIVIIEQKKFLRQFLRPSVDYESYLLDPAPFVAALPAKIDFVRNLKYDINVPAKYDVLVTHPNYFYVKGELIFNDNSLKKTIHMSKLRGKIDVKSTTGTKDSGKIEDN